ncbi:hypothetical protein EV421DRAFT_1740418 [Armillaria borealis]|uniref:Uncharacterized protein n=1 Tax=Armillaria borealis TaxID=47425 RepID=A0AA39MIL0_9AGAR|nr:hypothetical protein EV421DRAFT_1740418 [Armillaria borealis]
MDGPELAMVRNEKLKMTRVSTVARKKWFCNDSDEDEVLELVRDMEQCAYRQWRGGMRKRRGDGDEKQRQSHCVTQPERAKKRLYKCLMYRSQIRTKMNRVGRPSRAPTPSKGTKHPRHVPATNYISHDIPSRQIRRLRILSASDTSNTSESALHDFPICSLPSELSVKILHLFQPTEKQCEGRYKNLGKDESKLRTDTIYLAGCPSYIKTTRGLNHGSLRTSLPADGSMRLAKLRPMPNKRLRKSSVSDDVYSQRCIRRQSAWWRQHLSLTVSEELAHCNNGISMEEAMGIHELCSLDALERMQPGTSTSYLLMFVNGDTICQGWTMVLFSMVRIVMFLTMTPAGPP